MASGDVVRRDGASGWQCRCHAPLLGACDTQHDSPGDPTDLVLATTSPPEVQNARRGDRSPKWHGGVAVERGDHCLQWDTEAASCSPSWWALNPRCNNRAPTGVRNRGLCGARRPPRRKGTADGRERPTGRHVWPAGSNTTIREVTSARGGCDRPSCSTSVHGHKPSTRRRLLELMGHGEVCGLTAPDTGPTVSGANQYGARCGRPEQPGWR